MGDALQESGTDAVGGGVPVGIGLDGDADVEAGTVVFEVGVEVIGVDGVGDVGRDQEAVGVGLGQDVGACGGAVGGETVADARDGDGEEVPVGALAEEGTDFFVVEKAHDF